MSQEDRPVRLLPAEILTSALSDKQVDRLRTLARGVGSASLALKEILEARTRVATAREEAEAAEARLRIQRLTQRRLTDNQRHGTHHETTGSGIEPEISDKAIDQLALKAFVRFAPLPKPEAERAWGLWEAEVRRRLPAFAAAEVCRRAKELRELVR